MNYNKYENYIRIGSSPETLENFPTPSSLTRALRDVDKDPFTDLEGYTHRNRVRHDVEDISLAYNILSEDDEKFILNAISPVWVYVELTNKKTKERTVHKMYAGDKQWDTFKIWKDEEGHWHTEDIAFSFTLTEE